MGRGMKKPVLLQKPPAPTTSACMVCAVAASEPGVVWERPAARGYAWGTQVILTETRAHSMWGPWGRSEPQPRLPRPSLMAQVPSSELATPLAWEEHVHHRARLEAG